MPTVIDSLIVQFGLDPKEYKKGEKDANQSLERLRQHGDRTAKQLEHSGKQGAAFFAGIRNEIVRLGAAILSVRTVSEFIQNVTQADTTTGRLANNLGIAAGQLRAWERAAKDFGGDAASIDADFKSLNNLLQQFQLTGRLPEQFLTGLARLGIDTRRFLDPAVPIFEKFYMIADKLVKLPATQRQPLGSMLGLSESTINMLSVGENKLREIVTHQEKISALSERDVALAKQRTEAWNAFINRIETAGRAILNNFQPYLDNAYRTIGNIADKLPDLLKWGEVNHPANLIENGVNAWRRAHGLPALGELPPDSRSATAPGKWVEANGRVGGTIRIGGNGDFEEQVFNAMRRLENSGEQAVSPKGAVGRNQVLPSTAAQYGYDPSRLTDPAYNDLVARAIIADLHRRYGDDPQAILAAYNGGPGRANSFLRAGRDPSVLPEETRRYLANYSRIAQLSATGGTGVAPTQVNTSSVNIGRIEINTQATDARNIAAEVGPAIRQSLLTSQANSGMAP